MQKHADTVGNGIAALRRTGSRSQVAWTDFHTVLVVAQYGIVARACGALGTTHSTLLRKLDQIEHRMRTRMFERTRGQYAPTAAGAEMVEVTRGFETLLAIAAETRISGQDLRPHGEVRVSAAPIVIDYLLAPALAQFGSAFPGIQIELSASRITSVCAGARRRWRSASPIPCPIGWWAGSWRICDSGSMDHRAAAPFCRCALCAN